MTDNDKRTGAMIAAASGYIPNKYWFHSPYIKDIDGYTVAMILK